MVAGWAYIQFLTRVGSGTKKGMSSTGKVSSVYSTVHMKQVLLMGPPMK